MEKKKHFKSEVTASFPSCPPEKMPMSQKDFLLLLHLSNRFIVTACLMTQSWLHKWKILMSLAKKNNVSKDSQIYFCITNSSIHLFKKEGNWFVVDSSAFPHMVCDKSFCFLFLNGHLTALSSMFS